MKGSMKANMQGRKNTRCFSSSIASNCCLLLHLLLENLKRKARRWTMNGFHIKTKVIVDHKIWPLSFNSSEVIESVKTSVRGKIALKQRKRLIFMWSFRKLKTLVLRWAGSGCPLMLQLFVEVFLLQLAAGNFLITADCSAFLCGS